ncbi:MAG: hypothetical protein Q6356_003330 [Candidatus Wukongarchaeota archaeon]|nr:hypothetical protein [Candidatus Wukongarchaeota archaeon]
MQKNGFLKALVFFLALFGWLLSLALTINLTVQTFGTRNAYWTFIGIGAGLLLNVGEIAALLYYKYNKEKSAGYAALVLCFVFALVSVSASIGALEKSYESGERQSRQYQQTLKSLALQDSVIQGLNQTAKDQRKFFRATRSSRETLKEAKDLLGERNRTLAKLDEVKENSSGLNGTLFLAYCKLFGSSVPIVATVCNVVISLLIEITMLFFSSISIENDRRFFDNDGYDGSVEKANLRDIPTEVEKQVSSLNTRIASKNRDRLEHGSGLSPAEKKVLDKLPFTQTDDKKEQILDAELDSIEAEKDCEKARAPMGFQLNKTEENLSLSEKKNNPEKFERSNEFLSLSENKPEENVSLSESKKLSPSENKIPVHIITKLKREYEQTGKSDAAILWLWDSGVRNKSKIGRVAGKILRGNRKKISPSYVVRVLQRDREEGGGV